MLTSKLGVQSPYWKEVKVLYQDHKILRFYDADVISSLQVNWTSRFFIRKPFLCVSLNFPNMTLEIRLRFS